MARDLCALRLRAIRKQFVAGIAGCSIVTHALRGAELSLERREFLALIGPAGSGKSTLLRCAAGLLLPDEGLVVRPAPEGGRRASTVYFDLGAPIPGPGAMPSTDAIDGDSVLLLDGCDGPEREVGGRAWELLAAIRDRRGAAIVAARSIESCVAILPVGVRLSVASIEHGVVARAGIPMRLPQLAGRVAEAVRAVPRR